MSVDFQFLNRTKIPVDITTAAAHVTNASGKTTFVSGIYLYNTHSGDVEVSVYVVPNNAGAVGSAATGNLIYKRTLPAGEDDIINDLPLILDGTNDTIQAVADTDKKVNLFIFGCVQS